MEPICFPCPGCQMTLRVGGQHAGKTVACPKCKHKTVAPAFSFNAEPLPPPAPPPPPPPAVAEPANTNSISFPCAGCAMTLRVGSQHVGKTVACPKCKQQTVAPMFSFDSAPLPVEPEPPPPPPTPTAKPAPAARSGKPIRFKCMKCKDSIEAPVSKAGQTIECPECFERTLVPDEQEEIETYSFGDQPKKGSAKRARPVPIVSWWPDAKEWQVPPHWRHELVDAREHAEDGRWKQALKVLHALHEQGRMNQVKDAHILRKPLAYCLSRWAIRELDRIDDAGDLSAPMKRLLKRAAELRQYGGRFRQEECPLCKRTLYTPIGTTQVRTVVGFAYLCCAAPTDGDAELVQRVKRVDRKLLLASGIEPDHPDVQTAMESIPEWYRSLDMTESWWTRPVKEGGQPDEQPRGSLMGEILGDALGDALGGLLE